MAKERVDSRNQNTRGNLNNHANQLNPNNEAHWKSRGHDNKPIDRRPTPSKEKEK